MKIIDQLICKKVRQKSFTTFFHGKHLWKNFFFSSLLKAKEKNQVIFQLDLFLFYSINIKKIRTNKEIFICVALSLH